MTEATLLLEATATRVLLGAEAVAQGALDAGITAAWGYPGTPSTEILDHVLAASRVHGRPKAGWCANEKTAYEAALGASMAGRRALVTMKHVGLNVAADPFINSALVRIGGGLVLAIADDPGMYSSQNEQDSRVLADFARTICLEPSDQQEAYEMTREAFEISERFHVPVMVRLVTCLSHSRTTVRLRPPVEENTLHRDAPRASWILLPANARRLWKDLLARQRDFAAWSEASPHNPLDLRGKPRGLGVITTGVARNHYLESRDELEEQPSHLHIGAYPLPVEKIRALAEHVDEIVVLEEGAPHLERLLRGLLPGGKEIRGKMDGALPPDGELTPDLVRAALGLPGHPSIVVEGLKLPGRPPQLCQGCPHRDSFEALKKALAGLPGRPVVAGDIGCYTLGALPPFQAIESCVCMGASIGMARGAAAAGLHPAIAVIGDSTFLHSGVTALMDAVAEDADMTVLILDNETVAMTGAQTTVLPSSRIEQVVRGVGVDPAHVRVIEAHPRRTDEMAAVLRSEIEHRGLSVVITVRQCIVAAKKEKGVATPE